MREIFVGDLVFTRKPLELEIDMTYTLGHHPAELGDALSVISDRSKLIEVLKRLPTPSDLNPTVVAEYVSVVSRVFHVLRRLRRNERVEIKPLFVGLERSAEVATFMALLELVTHGRIAFSEEQDFIEMRGVEV
jgi:segregation and condensation protein A